MKEIEERLMQELVDQRERLLFVIKRGLTIGVFFTSFQFFMFLLNLINQRWLIAGINFLLLGIMGYLLKFWWDELTYKKLKQWM